MLSFTINVNAWEKVPVPDYVDKKTKSPWNFFENFEDGKLRFKYVANSKDISNSPGKKPYKIKKDLDGNSYLEITVKHKWNKCCLGNFYSERAEIKTRIKNAKNNIIWYGFRVRFPKDFSHIDDRLLIHQFSNYFDLMKKSPLFSIHYYSLGNEIDFGGHTGGIATTSWNKKENIINSVNLKYQKVKKDNVWELARFKKRNYAFISPDGWTWVNDGWTYDDTYGTNLLICDNSNTKTPDCGNDEMIDFNETINSRNRDWSTCDTITNDKCYRDGKLISKKIDKSNSIKGVKNFKDTNLGEWTTYKIGIRNSKKEDGFVKVYKDNQLIMDYQGITFKWKGNYKGTFIKLGPYRDSDPSGKGYPSQSIHYDDFIVVSDKKTLDKYLDK
jgi:hypothetical protein